MTALDERFHEMWMGMVQPIEGLVVSMPVLLDAQIAVSKGPRLQSHIRALHVSVEKKRDDDESGVHLRSVRELVADPEVLAIGPELRDDALPDALSLYVPEGKETLRPTWAIRNPKASSDAFGDRYQLLAWELPPDVDLDRPDPREGVWAYPPRAKFDRLLRHAGVPIGLLTNGRVLRLMYAPAGESTGAITFRLADMLQPDGRPILDAFVMLLHASRFEGAAEGRSLAEILANSRKVQAEVSKELEGQVKAALETLLRGFEEAAERDDSDLVAEAYREGTLYHGLLTLLLRLVFVLFAEDRELLPIEHATYREGMSVLGLFERLQADAARYPDAMSRRFGAYARLVALFRAIFLGVRHRDLVMPARRGDLFDPHRFPFLEGWGPAGGAPITLEEDRAAVRVPTVDDGCIYEVLTRLLYLKRERLSYRALDVEQIGSVYEGLIGYGIHRTASPAVRLGPYGVWIELADLLGEKPSARAKWLEERSDLPKKKCEEIAKAVSGTKTPHEAADAIGAFVKDDDDRVGAGRLVVQPGPDRKHTSSHYTPRSLSEPIVEKTLRPLLRAMGDAPASERILSLKVCDPAMGSGAFLVAACRFLGGEVVAAWTREGTVADVASRHGDVVTHARRLVAQRCLYGVDKNPFAVSLGKLSLWLATLAKDEPFTFVDHALRCGDSLVGLSFEQIAKFTWEPVAPAREPKKGEQLELDLFQDEIAHAMAEALKARQRIEQLATERSLEMLKEKERLLDDANDAFARVRLIGDLVVGAFFDEETAKGREAERARREERVRAWLRDGGRVPNDLAALADKTRRERRPFHWPVEFPEVFFAERPDPLETDQVNRVAFMDAFVGNPPFAGKNAIGDANGGPVYLDWLMAIRPEVQGRPNTDLVTYFFRAVADLLGANGTMGLIATKTIAQGDSRLVGLRRLVEKHGALIYAAATNLRWPGTAAVTVSVVHIALGTAARTVRLFELNGVRVTAINSRLRAGAERGEPEALASNADIAFMGGKLVGVGLAVDEEEYRVLLRADARNANVLRPYIGGEEVNRRPDGRHERYMIDFSAMTLAEARGYPQLMRIVEERVRPAREKDNRGTYRTYWWKPGESGGALYAALRGLRRCLVTSNVSKHMIFSFQPTTPFFSHALYVFALDTVSAFGVMQSRVHEQWVRLLSSSMKTDLRYAASDCFDTFAFPGGSPRTVIPAVETAAHAFYEARAGYMKDENVGLTITYNRMKDPECTDARVVELRELTLAMDRAVLEAYGWHDLVGSLPPFTTPRTDAERRAFALFEDTVIDRLFDLNAKYAAAQDSAPKRPAAAKEDDDEDEADGADAPATSRTRTKRAKAAPKRKRRPA